MLGRFLELSRATPDIQASLHFYAKLGFSEAEVGEAWQHPYAVVTDGRISLGLHQHAGFPSSVTFVRPELLRHLDTFERLGTTFEFRRLGNDVFNEVGWFDPSGNLIRVVEARTFSPSKRRPMDVSACGYFQEIALPAASTGESKEHWERLGFVGMDSTDDPLPHVTCTSDTLDVGLYEPTHVGTATLVFEVDRFADTAAALGALGLTSGKLPGALRNTSATQLRAPEGTPLLICAAPA